MKAYEDYLTLRTHYHDVQEGQEIQVSMEALSALLFCTPRNTKHILNKLMEQRWLHYQPGIGRGKLSTIIFLYSSQELLMMAVEERLAKGNLTGALELIKQYGRDQSIKRHFQQYLSSYFGFSQERLDDDVVETLRLPIFRTINTLHPPEAFYSLDTHLVKQIYNTLVEYDPIEQSIRPALAHYWESHHEGREWVFYMRKKIRFHNGKELTAYDVLDTLQRLGTSRAKWLVESIQEMNVVNRYCLRIQLHHRSALFPLLLSCPQASIVPQEENAQTHSSIVGTGPYRVTTFSAELCSLEAFDQYYEYRAFMDKVELYNLSHLEQEGLEPEKVLFKQNGERLFIETGEAQHLNIPEWEQKQEICGTTVLTINCRKDSPLQDKNLRKAMHHLINREKMVQDLGHLRVAPAHSFQLQADLTSQDGEYNESIGLQLLRCSQYANETLTLFTYKRHEDDAYWLKEHLHSFGIQIDVHITSWSHMLEPAVIQAADLILFEAIINEGIPRFLEYYSSDYSFLKHHFSFKQVEEIRSILSRAYETSSNLLEMTAALQQIEEQLLTEHSFIFLTYKLFSTHYHPSLHSSALHFGSWLDFKQIWFKG